MTEAQQETFAIDFAKKMFEIQLKHAKAAKEEIDAEITKAESGGLLKHGDNVVLRMRGQATVNIRHKGGNHHRHDEHDELVSLNWPKLTAMSFEP